MRDFMDRKFLQEYLDYSPVERMACFLTLDLNHVLNWHNYGSYVHIILIEHDKDKLKYYWFEETIRSCDVRLNAIPDNQEKLEKIISLQYNVLKEENAFDVEWSQIGAAYHVMDLDAKGIYIIAVGNRNVYSSYRFWEYVIAVFAQNWEWTLDCDRETEILKIPSPTDAAASVNYYWRITGVSCCRVMAEGGFCTGYGDPYESSVFYEVVSRMASSYYEKRESKGLIVPIKDDIKLIVSFAEPILIDLSNCKVLRKYLEMAREGFALAVKDDSFVGLARADCSNGVIEFLGANQWRYCESGEVIFSYDNGNINISTSITNREDGTDEELGKDDEIIKEITRVAQHQKHGTTLLFSSEAEYESKRLANYNRCQLIRPISLLQNKDVILPLTSIDGALIIGFDGNCYGAGAILDGEAMKAGNIGRGARYNSALNYIAWKKQKSKENSYCAVIISEDGVTNVVTSENVEMINDDSSVY